MKKNETTEVDEWREDYRIENRRIKSVTLSKESGRNARISLNLEGESFKNYKFGTGEKNETNNISFDIANINAEFGEFSDYITVANGYMMGGAIPPQIISFALANGTITVERLFKAKGEKREKTNDTYTQDLYKTRVVSFTPNVTPLAAEQLKELLGDLRKQSLKVETVEQKPSQSATFGVKLIW